jgi:GAF domain-containing protein
MENDKNTETNLIDLSYIIENNVDFLDCLGDLAEKAGNIFHVKNCSIMLLTYVEELKDLGLKIYSNYGYLPPVAYTELPDLNKSISGYALKTGEKLIINDIQKSEFQSMARRLNSGGKCFMIAPIKVHNTCLGVMNVSNPLKKIAFSAEDLKILNLFTIYIGKSIQLIQVQNFLSSKFLGHIAINDEMAADHLTDYCVIPNPDNFAKILAKSFYKEMARAGFDANHIISAASEVIAQLTQRLDKHKKRIERKNLRAL